MVRSSALVQLALALGGAAAPVAASVQLFFTPGSGPPPFVAPGPASIWQPTAGHGTDQTNDGYMGNLAAFPTAFAPSTTITSSDFAWVWLKFVTDSQAGPGENAKLQGIHLRAAGWPDDIVYYPQDDTAGTWGERRWDDPMVGIPFKNRDEVLVALTAAGLPNRAAALPANLYSGAPHRVALLGAVRYSTPGTYTFTLGSLGIYFNTGAIPAVEFGKIVVIPEPAALLLLAGSTLLVRRR